MLLELSPERIAVDPEELGGPDLVALGLADDGAEQGLLDQAHHQAVEVGGGMPAQAADAVVHRLLDSVLERGVGAHGG